MEFSLEPGERIFVGGSSAGDGLFVAELKAFVISEIAGHQKVENRPDIRHGVFDGRSRQDKTLLRRKHFDGFCVFSLTVFDVLGLVKNDGVEVSPEPRLVEISL